MSHQPFEQMIFDRNNLSDDEVVSLDGHLQECDQCRSLTANWHEVDRLFRHAEATAPAAGFSHRFQVKLLRQRHRAAHRQLIGLVTVLTLGLVVTAGLFGAELVSLSFSMASTLLKVLIGVIQALTYVNLAGSFVWAILENTLGRVSPGFWLFISASLSFISVVWFATMYRFGFYQIRRE
jgi:predicted anti-sigma-YlaC factor YlaD